MQSGLNKDANNAFESHRGLSPSAAQQVLKFKDTYTCFTCLIQNDHNYTVTDNDW